MSFHEQSGSHPAMSLAGICTSGSLDAQGPTSIQLTAGAGPNRDLSTKVSWPHMKFD